MRLTMFGKLMLRALSVVLPLWLMIGSVVVGYASYPVLSPLLKENEFINFVWMNVGEPERQPAAVGPVTIYPVPGPVKLILDEKPEPIKQTEPDVPATVPEGAAYPTRKIRSLVPAMGEPRPVKTFRISKSGSIIDDNPVPASH